MRRLRVPLWAVLAFLVFTPPAAGDPRPGGSAAAAVSVARSESEARDILVRDLPKAGGRLLLVSPHDYLTPLLLPLARTKALKEVAVVLPSEEPLSARHLDELRAFLGKAGVAEADLAALSLDNGSIRGRAEGADLRVAPVTAIPVPAGSPLLVLDTAFLPAMYEDDVRTPMVGLARKLMLTLGKAGVASGTAVVFDAAGRDDFPLEWGFLASLLREMLEAPGSFEGTPPEKWRLLAAAETSFFFSQYPEATTLYKEYLGKAPGDASACYKIALLAARDLDPGMALSWLNRASGADPAYRRAYADIAEYFTGKGLHDGAERVLRGGLSAFPGDGRLASRLAVLLAVRGDDLAEGGDAAGAAELYRRAAAVEGADPALRARALEMAERAAAPPPP